VADLGLQIFVTLRKGKSWPPSACDVRCVPRLDKPRKQEKQQNQQLQQHGQYGWRSSSSTSNSNSNTSTSNSRREVGETLTRYSRLSPTQATCYHLDALLAQPQLGHLTHWLAVNWLLPHSSLPCKTPMA
jgi:hypothetical protein